MLGRIEEDSLRVVREREFKYSHMVRVGEERDKSQILVQSEDGRDFLLCLE